jgi:polyhydroxybutyrate depolymerase
MTRVVALLAATVSLAALAGCATTPAPADDGVTIVPAAVETQTVLSVGGIGRTVTIRDVAAADDGTEPSTDPVTGVTTEVKRPALVLLHGATGSSQRAERTSGFSALAKQNGFVVAYPDGTSLGMPAGGLAWNAGGCCGRAAVDKVDDVAFLDAVLDDLIANHAVDPSRIYLGGFSNGAMMTYRFACEEGERLAGIIAVSGALNVPSCEAPSALPVLIIHGTDDPTVAYDGGPVSSAVAERLGAWTNASVADSAEFWADRDGCSGSSTLDAGRVQVEDFSGCGVRSSVEVVTITGGTHHWPTVASEQFDASAYIVDHFGL